MLEDKKYVIAAESTVGYAQKTMSENGVEILFLIDKKLRVCASLSEGDIRRALLAGRTISSPILDNANEDFVWLKENSTRETILKKLDQKIKIIPILDNHKKLIRIVNKDNIPSIAEELSFVRSRAPARVSFGGGGSDLTSYFVKDRGAVLNATISLYSHATLRKRDDKNINIFSRDLNENFSCENIECLKDAPKSFGLFKSLVFVIDPTFGFDLYVESDFKPGSGLGGSATVSTAVIGCFNEYREDKWSPNEIAGLAFQAERLQLGILGGWQDQYASVFGGFNFIEFMEHDNIIHSLKVRQSVLMELEESLILFNTGKTHDSNVIHASQKTVMQSDEVKKYVSENVSISYKLRNCILAGDLRKFGSLLDKSWQLKKKFSPLISNSELDQIYSLAIKNGATGGKLLGAGGGGYFMLFVPPFEKFKVLEAFQKIGLLKHTFHFESRGLKACLSRESNFYGDVDGKI